MGIAIENGRARYMGTGIDINPTNDCPELYIRGEYICGWSKGVAIDGLLAAALNEAAEHGKQQKAREIRKALGMQS